MWDDGGAGCEDGMGIVCCFGGVCGCVTEEESRRGGFNVERGVWGEVGGVEEGGQVEVRSVGLLGGVEDPECRVDIGLLC